MSRAALLALAAGDRALDAGAYVAGVAELAAIGLPLAFAAVRLRSRLLPGWTGAPARLAEAIAWLALLIWTAQLVGAFGLFEPLPLIAAGVVVGIGVGMLAEPPFSALMRRSRAGHEPAGSDRPAVDRASGGAPGDQGLRPGWPAIPRAGWPAISRPGWPAIALAALAAALVAAAWAIPSASSFAGGITGVDSMWYHLPQSARFAQTESVNDLLLTDPYFINWYYPASTELLHAIPMLAFDRDFVSPVVNHAFLALGLLAAWCIGRPWGVGPQAMIGAAIVFGSEMMIDFQPGQARNDAAGLAVFLAAVALLIGAARGPLDAATRRFGGLAPAPLALAGIAAGIAVGIKLTLLAPIAALTVGVVVLAGWSGWLRATGVWLAALLAAGGYWYARNLVLAGNPLPWVGSIGPIELPTPLVALELRPPFTVADYIGDSAVWEEWFRPGLVDSIGPLWPAIAGLVVVGALLALVAGLWRGREAGIASAGPAARRLVPVLGAVVVATLVAYVYTPLTASGPEGEPEGFVWNLRYIAPALGLGLALVAIVPPLRARYARIAVLVVLFAILAVQTVRLGVWDAGHEAWAIGSAAMVLAGFGAVLALRASWAGRRTASVATTALVVLSAAGLALAGFLEQGRYLDRRYADSLESLHLERPLAWAQGVSGSRIATSGRGGVFFQYGFYGTDLSNRVQWIGKPAPRGSLLPIGSCENWRQTVNAGDYDYVVTTYDRRFPAADTTSREREWVRRDPAATLIAADGPSAVYRLRGRLDPDGCGPSEIAAESRATGVSGPEDR